MARPTKIDIHGIAKEASVSIATVSRVINNHQGVSEKVRKKVRKILDQKGCLPRVVTNRCPNIGVIIEMGTPIIESFGAMVLSGIAKYGLEQNIETSTLFIHPGKASSYDLLTALRERRCDAAVIVFGSDFSDKQLKSLTSADLPTVLVAAQRDLTGIGYIDIDSCSGGTIATEHLIKQGHKHIAYLAGPTFQNHDNEQRVTAFIKTMIKHGFQKNAIVIPHQPTEMTQEAGYKQATIALNQHSDLTAIFANNDEMAYGAMLACSEAGKKIPEDISIIGFDDYPNSSYCTPPLTTVRQPLTIMGYEAMKMADLASKGMLEKLPQNLLQGILIERKSTTNI